MHYLVCAEFDRSRQDVKEHSGKAGSKLRRIKNSITGVHRDLEH